MNIHFCVRRVMLLILLVAHTDGSASEKMLVGPETERRFPPLTLPAGFEATLFACDPLIEYPSVIALGPRPGTLHVAHDYMTGLGREIVRRDEVRLIEDTDGDGYADTSHVVAGDFNSIQGLAYHHGSIYVMHAPKLTALIDSDGDGAFDARRDLLEGLGLPPEENPPRLHCANGVTVGHDGWLYLALGDHGCDILRPEGDRLVFQGGGILRCRFDGGDAHVFSTGLRNIYDVALDADLNVFVRDNENDGGTYKIRVCHSFYSADHGYPYLYEDYPQEALAPLADLGLGSSAGVTCYLEHAFPPAFRGQLFTCEWGRAVVRYPLAFRGSGFAPTVEVDFASGAPTDPYGFKPTDVIVDYDGSLLISDWADGQRPKRGRGRIYRIRYGSAQTANNTPEDLAGWLKLLGSPSHHARWQAQEELLGRGTVALNELTAALHRRQLPVLARLHAVWVLARGRQSEAIEELLKVARLDPSPRVAVNAVRALGDLADPVLLNDQLAAGPGDYKLATRVADLAKHRNEPQMLREIVCFLGRLKWSELPEWLSSRLDEPDGTLAHAASQALRQCGNWEGVLNLLDSPQASVHSIARVAIIEQYEAAIVEGLARRLSEERSKPRKLAYAQVLTRVWKKPGPWQYWGYRPPPRPPNTATWSCTEQIEAALDRLLADSNPAVRARTLGYMLRAAIGARPATLSRWLDVERNAETVALMLEAIEIVPEDTREILTQVIGTSEHTPANRRVALAMFVEQTPAGDTDSILSLAKSLPDDEVLADVIDRLAASGAGDSAGWIGSKLGSASPAVRAAALRALAAAGDSSVQRHVENLLGDESPLVLSAAAWAAGETELDSTLPRLLELARHDDPAVRRECLVALQRLDDPSALEAAVDCLESRVTRAAALEYLAVFGGPEYISDVVSLAGKSYTRDTIEGVLRALSGWQQRSNSRQKRDVQSAIATVQGTSGIVAVWQNGGPFDRAQADHWTTQLAGDHPANSGIEENFRSQFGSGEHAEVRHSGPAVDGKRFWISSSNLLMDEQTEAQFFAASDATYRLYLNGEQVFGRGESAPFKPDADQFPARLREGPNPLLLVLEGGEPPRFHLRFRRKSSQAELEQFTQAALLRNGNVERGRQVFHDDQRALCTRCHRMNAQGGNIGPELTGVAKRFSRIHLIEALLEPSRTIANGYDTVVVEMSDGRVLQGVRVKEDDVNLTIADNQAQSHVLAKIEIDTLQTSIQSSMPEGIEKRLSEQEFVDLVAFLLSQTENAAAPKRGTGL